MRNAVHEVAQAMEPIYASQQLPRRPTTSPEGGRARARAQLQQPSLGRADSSPDFNRHGTLTPPTDLLLHGRSPAVPPRRRFQVAPGGAIGREERFGAMYRWHKELGQGEFAADRVGSNLGSDATSSNVRR